MPLVSICFWPSWICSADSINRMAFRDRHGSCTLLRDKSRILLFWQNSSIVTTTAPSLALVGTHTLTRFRCLPLSQNSDWKAWNILGMLNWWSAWEGSGWGGVIQSLKRKYKRGQNSIELKSYSMCALSLYYCTVLSFFLGTFSEHYMTFAFSSLLGCHQRDCQPLVLFSTFEQAFSLWNDELPVVCTLPNNTSR